MNWKRFIILICSIACMAGGVKLVEACAGSDEPDNPGLFLKNINEKPAFTPFYYTPYRHYYTDYNSYDEYGYKPLNDNSQSWKRYTGNAVSDDDIDSFVYSYNAKDVMNIYQHILKGYKLNVPATVAQNGFTKWLIKNKNHETALYLAFAKECEPYARPIEEYWDNSRNEYLIKKRDSAAMQEMVHVGIKRIISAVNPEIKLRYAYQCMRMAFYSGEYAQTTMIFNTLVSPAKHVIYYRCLSLKAGALYKTKKYKEAAYLYSHVFDSSNDLKQQAHQSFKWATSGKIDDVLPLCRTDHERAVLYIMKGLYSFESENKDMVSTLEKAYQLDPKAKGIEVLMSRGVSILEEELLTAAIAGKPAKSKKGKDLILLSQKIATEGKCGSVPFWHIASAYLCMLSGDITNCKKYLDKAARYKLSHTEQDTHSIITALYIISKNGAITAVSEKELLPILKSIQRQKSLDGWHNQYDRLMQDILISVLQERYLLQKDTIKAIYCNSKNASYYQPYSWSDVYSDDLYSYAGPLLEGSSVAQLQKIEAFILKKDKTPFEVWLTENTIYPSDKIFELEGTKYIRMLQFDKAVEVFKNLPDTLLNKWILPDAFVSHLTDYTAWNRSDSGVTYTKLTFAKRMLELQQKLEIAPGDYRAAYQYANGLYSMSYYGKSFRAFAYYRSSADFKAYYATKERKSCSPADLNYYTVSLAEHYYKQAFANTTDPEQKARCLFLAAKCWQKNCPVKNEEEYFFGDEQLYYKNALQNPYFSQMKNGYANTTFFKKTRGTCSYLRDYLRSRK
jgi:hypothetical protein